MTPGTIMRTNANILIKVKVTCVREARLTLQQFTATTNARKTQITNYASTVWETLLLYKLEKKKSRGKPLTHSEDTDEFD